MKVWVFLELMLVTLHVSEPYISTNLTFELNMRSLVRVEIAVNFHTGRSIAKDCRAFLILAVMSSSVPPRLADLTTQVDKFFHIFCWHSFDDNGCVLSAIDTHHFGLLLADPKSNPL